MDSGGTSRRQVLALAGSGLAALAGCTGGDSDPDGVAENTSQDEHTFGRPTARTTLSPTPHATEDPSKNTIEKPPHRTLRTTDGAPAVTSTAYEAEQQFYEDEVSWAWEDWLVTTEDQRDALTLAENGPGVEAASSFVADTDLDANNLLIHQYNVDRCHSRVLETLEWGGRSGVFLTYGVTRREGACGTGTADMDSPPYEDPHNEATIVRVSDELDGYAGFSAMV